MTDLPVKKKRGRPSKADIALRAAAQLAHDNSGNTTPTPQPTSDTQGGSDHHGTISPLPDTSAPPPPRKRGRPSKADVALRAALLAQTGSGATTQDTLQTTSDPPPPRKRGRPSKADIALRAAQLVSPHTTTVPTIPKKTQVVLPQVTSGGEQSNVRASSSSLRSKNPATQEPTNTRMLVTSEMCGQIERKANDNHPYEPDLCPLTPPCGAKSSR